MSQMNLFPKFGWRIIEESTYFKTLTGDENDDEIENTVIRNKH